MKIAPACFSSDSDQGDALMSFLPEPEQSTLAKWTPKDQMDWNRITANNPREGEKYSPFGVRTTKIKIISAGCGGDDSSIDVPVDESDPEETLIDHDGDGYYQNGMDVLDCDDENANIHPGAEEVCDGKDNNCDREVDENCNVRANDDQNSNSDQGSAGVRNADQDRDGFTPDQGDCDDTNASMHPGATEIRNNNLDDDCNDGDEECPHAPQEGPRGVYNNGNQISGFSFPVEEGCSDYLPGTANEIAFSSGDSFTIRAQQSSAFCIGAYSASYTAGGCNPETEICCNNGIHPPLYSTEPGYCETDDGMAGFYAAVAKIGAGGAGLHATVSCGGLEFNRPAVAFFLNPQDSYCVTTAQLDEEWWYSGLMEEHASSNLATGIVYFAAAGPVPFACRVTLE